MSNDPVDVSAHTGAMLRMVSQWVRDEVYAGVVAAGYTDLNPAHIWVFRYPGPDGIRPSALAVELQVTKQSVNDLMGDLERRGYLIREPDPTDGRARVVRLTRKGRRLEKAFADQARAAELRIAGTLGARRFGQLCSILEDLSRDLPAAGGASSIRNTVESVGEDRAVNGSRSQIRSETC
jgi:DNA-binding MarR family transcriptional regulator